MSNTTLTQLQEGLTTAYIDGTAAANLAYKPAFVSNNPEEGKKVISVIEDELMKCDQFQISVSEFDWNFSAIHKSSPAFSTDVGAALHGVLPPLQPAHG